jgi:hypothetical protein
MPSRSALVEQPLDLISPRQRADGYLIGSYRIRVRGENQSSSESDNWIDASAIPAAISAA